MTDSTTHGPSVLSRGAGRHPAERGPCQGHCSPSACTVLHPRSRTDEPRGPRNQSSSGAFSVPGATARAMPGRKQRKRGKCSTSRRRPRGRCASSLRAPSLNPLMAAGPDAWGEGRRDRGRARARARRRRPAPAVHGRRLRRLLQVAVARHEPGADVPAGRRPLLPNWRHLPVATTAAPGTVVGAARRSCRPAAAA